MYYELIKNNIEKLNTNIVDNYLKNNNIYLSNQENNLIVKIVKANWEDLYHKNYEKTFKIIKENLSFENYNKLLNLYLKTINQYLN